MQDPAFVKAGSVDYARYCLVAINALIAEH
jgi:hypothetical protein